MPAIARTFLLIFISFSQLFCAANPIVLLNEQRFSQINAFIPLPDKQIIKADSIDSNRYTLSDKQPIKLLLEPFESLKIEFTKKSREAFSLEYSQDGRIFKSLHLQSDENGSFVYDNPYALMLALRLTTQQTRKISLFTSLKDSVLNRLNSSEIDLGKEHVSILDKSTLITKNYYSLKKDENASFEIRGPGIISLKSRSALHPIENLNSFRQRLDLGIDAKPIQSIEFLNSLNTNYALSSFFDEEPVSGLSSYYFSLPKGEHNISIRPHCDVLLRADFFHDNVLNDSNAFKLGWEVKNEMLKDTQAKWKNSIETSALERYRVRQPFIENIQDPFQKSLFQEDARQSTLMKSLTPENIPLKGSTKHLYYGMRSIDFEESIGQKIQSASGYEKALIYKLHEGFFTQVPDESTLLPTEESAPLLVNTLHFKTRQYTLDKPLLRQVERTAQLLKPYDSIHIYGYTDSTDTEQNNQLLSLRRCNNIKDALLEMGFSPQMISVYALGEYSQDVETEDSVREDSNRRVEIRVVHTEKSNKELTYLLKDETSAPSHIEITLLSKKMADAEVYFQIDKQEPQQLSFIFDEDFKKESFSQEIYAYEALAKSDENLSIKVLSHLKNTKGISLVKNTGTIRLEIPKGSKQIRLFRKKGSADIEVNIRMQDTQAYKDSLEAMLEYKGSYKKFADSLISSAPKGFDPWYEQTKSLRLWMLARISQAKQNLNTQKVPDALALDYAYKLAQENERYTALQIAKHILVLQDDPLLRSKAYEFLLQLSDEKRKLNWHSLYFMKTSSPQALKQIVTGLYNEGSFDLALRALLLLEPDDFYQQKAKELSLILNDPWLREHFLNDSQKKAYKENKSDAFFLAKDELDKNELINKNIKTRDINISSAFGLSKLYSLEQKRHFSFYKSTWTQPLRLNFQGPLTLNLDLRTESASDLHHWVRFKHNTQTYHYPLSSSQESPSLQSQNKDINITLGHELNLSFAKGQHTLELHAYTQPLLIRVQTQTQTQEPKPLSEQLLETSNFDPLNWINQELSHTSVYASALLWIYEKHYKYHYNALSQALLLSNETDDPDITGMLKPILLFSSFIPYKNLSSAQGVYDASIPSWSPQSKLQKSRTALLENINEYDLVLRGSDYQIIQIQGPKNISLEAEQLVPHYLPSVPLDFAIQVDENSEEKISFSDLNKSLNKNLFFDEGAHSLKIRLLNPVSTHYLGLNIVQDKESLSYKHTKRYFVTTQNRPILIHDNGPKLLKIEESTFEGETSQRYLSLASKQSYQYQIPPLAGEKESLVCISELVLDHLQTPLEKMPVQDAQSHYGIETNRSQEISTYEPLPIDKNFEPTKQSLDPTYSLEALLLRTETSSQDSLNTKTQDVFQVGGYRRERLRDDLYIKQHYFTRLYDNPLYALRHKLYTKLPIEDLWGVFEADGYFQKSGQWYKDLHLNAELFIKRPIWPQFRQEYGLGLFKHLFINDKQPSSPLDPLVYSRYRQDHQHGAKLWNTFYYRPYFDTELSLDTSVTYNENLSLDHLGIKPKLNHLAYPFDLELYYDYRYYFGDQDRASGYNIQRLGAGMRYNKFFTTNRLELNANIVQKLQTNDTSFLIQMIWHFSENNFYYHFMPDEKRFNSLRQILDHER